MKMKTIIKLLFVFSLPFIFCRCADDGYTMNGKSMFPKVSI